MSETINDIVREMRSDYYKMSRSNARLNTELMSCLQGFADRIEAAQEREEIAHMAYVAKECAKVKAECERENAQDQGPWRSRNTWTGN